MILPSSQLYGLIILAIAMLCWGSWTSLYKMTSKWRWELFYFDFAVGFGLASLIFGFTVGTFGWDGFSLIDDVKLAGRHQDLYAFLAGALFNFGNMLMLGGIAICGVTVGSMVGLGVMLTSGFVILRFTAPSGNPMFLTIGAAVVLVAAIFVAVSSRSYSLARFVELMREGKTKTTRKVVSVKGLILVGIGGLVAGGFVPLVDLAREGENGLGPYALGVLFAVGLVSTTVVFNLFFMSLPVQGDVLEMGAYFKGKPKAHYLGLLAGMLCYFGILAPMVVQKMATAVAVPPVWARGLSLGAVVLGALWGIFRFREFKGAEGKVKTYIAVAFFLYAVGIGLLGYSAAYTVAG